MISRVFRAWSKVYGDFQLKFPVFIPYRSSIKPQATRSSAFFSTGLDEIGQFFGSSDGSAITRTWTGRNIGGLMGTVSWRPGVVEWNERLLGDQNGNTANYMKYLVNGWFRIDSSQNDLVLKSAFGNVSIILPDISIASPMYIPIMPFKKPSPPKKRQKKN